MRHATLAAPAVAVLLLLTFAAGPARSGGAPKDAPARPDPKALAAPIAEADKNLPRDDDYVVHEWGTFTSFSGSDGIALDFRPLVDEDLPAFVLDRPRQAFINDRRDRAYARGRSEKGLVISKQRMETPVTYFYTDRERLVDVTVEFPHGLLTEFYPAVRQFGPAYKAGQPEPLENSWLRWGKVRLIPAEQALGKTGVDPYIRPIASGENPHYAYARETDSAHVQITDPAMSMLYREKFLFYRGLGNFDLPIRVKSNGDGRFVLSNSGKTPLRYAFLVHVEGPTTVRFARYDGIGSSVDMVLPRQTATLDALSEQVVSALISDGLFEKEARAMVKTWKSSWFGETGTRVLYSLPQADTDALLPLRLDPAPKQLVRVMVGRLEIMTPEQESRIESLILGLGATDPRVRDQSAAEIRKLGRFAEPALARVAKLGDNPEMTARADALIRQMVTGKTAPIEPR